MFPFGGRVSLRVANWKIAVKKREIVVIDYCPICGYGPAFGYASPEELRHSYDICACCGCEFGYDDNVAHYEQWVAKGCPWFKSKARPPNWSLEEQLTHTIRPWPPER